MLLGASRMKNDLESRTQERVNFNLQKFIFNVKFWFFANYAIQYTARFYCQRTIENKKIKK
jgi:hypothetical protein